MGKWYNDMGDRTITYKICPECGKEYEEYDAPTCMMFIARCDCGWIDKRGYRELEDGTIELK